MRNVILLIVALALVISNANATSYVYFGFCQADIDGKQLCKIEDGSANPFFFRSVDKLDSNEIFENILLNYFTFFSTYSKEQLISLGTIEYEAIKDNNNEFHISFIPHVLAMEFVKEGEYIFNSSYIKRTGYFLK